MKAAPQRAPKLERAAVKVRKVVAGPSVINPTIPEPSVINASTARKRGRPIKSNDTAHQHARERARRYRARKAIAQTGKVTS